MFLESQTSPSPRTPTASQLLNVPFVFLCCLLLMACPTSVRSQELEAKKTSKKTAASAVTYSNRKSGLKAKSVQAAIDEVGTSLSSILSGKAGTVGASSQATTSTSWTGKRYFYAGGIEGKFGPPETLKQEAVTMTFTPTGDSTGTLTVTPVNFVCEIESEFILAGAGVCGTYGDVFSYSYKIFGTNLFVENGRTSSGQLIGEGVIDGAGVGEHLDIQSNGPNRLVLKYVDAVVSVWDLQLNK